MHSVVKPMYQHPLQPTLVRLLGNRLGISRSEATALISEGRVQGAEGAFLDPRQVIDPETLCLVDGLPLPPPRPARLLLMHKPRGHITGRSDPQGRPVLTPYLPEDGDDLRHIGRLDYNTTGLLLWTNCGRLQRALLDPHALVEKVYRIKIRDRIAGDDPRLERMASGTIDLDGTPVRPCRVEWEALRTRATWIRVHLTEGRFRQLRRMCAAVGFQIVKLERVAIGALKLPAELTPRCVREADEADWANLLRTLALDPAHAHHLARAARSVDELDALIAAQRPEDDAAPENAERDTPRNMS